MEEPPVIGATPGGGQFGPAEGPPPKADEGKKGIRALSLKQLKEYIGQIYDSKVKFDQKCSDAHLPKETLEQHMYTYLNQRYGLKSLIIEHASAIIKALNKFTEFDNDVSVFGKILRNEIDEDFRHVQTQLKDTVVELLRVYLKGQNPLKPDDAINDLLSKRMIGSIEEEEWIDIIKYMYNHEDSLALMVMVKDKIRHAELPQGPAEHPRGRRRSSVARDVRDAQAHAMTGIVSFSEFLKVLLDFQLKGHEKFLAKFRRLFRENDSDNNGVLDEAEFKNFVQSIDPSKTLGDTSRLLELTDPYNTRHITFSDCVSVLSSELVGMMAPGSARAAQLQNQ